MSVPVLAGPTLPIVPWPDPVIDTLGYDPRSAYVELFWLSILGPSTTWLLRHLVAGLDQHPEGYDLALVDAAAALGLGGRGGRNSPFVRSLARASKFGATAFRGSELAVRRKLPPLTRTQVERLPAPRQEAHRSWLLADGEAATATLQRRRARRLALDLAELGHDPEAIEIQLHRWHFHPALAHQAATWACDRRREATAALPDLAPPPTVRHTLPDPLGGDAA